MNILIIGGTVFLGRALVTAAVQRGHTVTLFNRGRSAPEALPEIEQLHGDREGDLAVLDGRTWDAVIDTCGYVPRIVRHSAAHLAPHTANYTFISSISVYADISRTGLTEADTAELGHLEDETIEEVTGESYGPLKLLCEEAATAEDADRALTDALSRLKPADAAAEVAKALGLPRRDLYRRAMELKGAKG